MHKVNRRMYAIFKDGITCGRVAGVPYRVLHIDNYVIHVDHPLGYSSGSHRYWTETLECKFYYLLKKEFINIS